MRLLLQTRLISVLTFALFGALSAGATRGDDTSAPMAIYSQSGSASAYYRYWIHGCEDADWSAQSTISPAPAANTPWITPLNSPVADESAAVIFDGSRNLSVQFATGTTWSSATTLCSNVGIASGGRGFSAAYDPAGKLVIAYWKARTSQLAIRVRSVKGTMGGESLYDIGTGLSGAAWVCLVPKPQSVRMLILVLDNSGKLIAGMWDGVSSASGWTTLASDVDSLSTESFAGAWEQVTRTPMVVYRRSGQTAPCYQRQVSGAWTAEATLTTTSPATFRPNYTRLAAKPSTNQILLCASDGSSNLCTALWNGTSWSSLANTASLHNQSSGRRTFDVAWQDDGTQALLVYGGQGGSAKFRQRTYSGGAWSGESVVGGQTATAQVVLLYPRPKTTEFWGLAMDAGNKVYFAKWSGATISTWTQLTAGSDYAANDSFGIVIPTTLAPADDAQPSIVNWYETEPH